MSGGRADGRSVEEMRPVEIRPGFMPAAEGSALISVGNTRVICTASVERGVPGWREGSGKGWITAEYAMLPRATDTRNPRDASRGGPSGRSREIQRLIGRSLRSVTRMDLLGELTIYIDCDVLQADGGTRTAAVTGAYVALVDALHWMRAKKLIAKLPPLTPVAAVSAGIVGGTALLDLCYAEDSKADVDFNIIMTGKGKFVEIQGTAEHDAFDAAQLQRLLTLARRGIRQLFELQQKALGRRKT